MRGCIVGNHMILDYMRLPAQGRIRSVLSANVASLSRTVAIKRVLSRTTWGRHRNVKPGVKAMNNRHIAGVMLAVVAVTSTAAAISICVARSTSEVPLVTPLHISDLEAIQQTPSLKPLASTDTGIVMMASATDSSVGVLPGDSAGKQILLVVWIEILNQPS